MKEHPTHKGYFVTEDGRVFSAWKWKSFGRGKGGESYLDYENLRQLKGYETSGYIHYGLANKVRITGHRLVAETYIPNPNNLPQVNHINKNRSDNRIENLEWCTNQQNCEHAFSKKYKIKNVTTEEEFFIFNLQKWARDNNLSIRYLRATLSGERPHHCGYKVISNFC